MHTLVSFEDAKYKLKEFAKLTEEQLEKKNEEVKKIDEEKRTLTAKCESYKAKVTDMVEKLGEETKVNRSLAMEIFTKKQMQEVEEHVKLLTSKETELAEAIERLEAEGEVVLQIIEIKSLEIGCWS